jgi:hypothetical protein
MEFTNEMKVGTTIIAEVKKIQDGKVFIFIKRLFYLVKNNNSKTIKNMQLNIY